MCLFWGDRDFRSTFCMTRHDTTLSTSREGRREEGGSRIGLASWIQLHIGFSYRSFAGNGGSGITPACCPPAAHKSKDFENLKSAASGFLPRLLDRDQEQR